MSVVMSQVLSVTMWMAMATLLFPQARLVPRGLMR